jgi:hypothetical protein
MFFLWLDFWDFEVTNWVMYVYIMVTFSSQEEHECIVIALVPSQRLDLKLNTTNFNSFTDEIFSLV